MFFIGNVFHHRISTASIKNYFLINMMKVIFIHDISVIFFHLKSTSEITDVSNHKIKSHIKYNVTMLTTIWLTYMC